MIIAKKVKQMRDFLGRAKKAHKTIGFVPTMGALHEGHLSLIRQAHKDNDYVVVSIFVNPIQFGPKEDFKKYPRDLRRDSRLCKKEKVDLIFYPDRKEMFASDFKTYISVEGLSSTLCGKARPGHFQGVTTVVNKLFNIVQPDVAYFGQKDAQQSVIIKKMAQDLNMPVKVKVLPIVREQDGLAMSSRNAYLNNQERKDSVVLYRALRLAKLLIDGGLKDSSRIISRIRQVIEKKKSAHVDYIAIVDDRNLLPVTKISGVCLVALAVRFGKTRLIDNIIICPRN